MAGLSSIWNDLNSSRQDFKSGLMWIFRAENILELYDLTVVLFWSTLVYFWIKNDKNNVHSKKCVIPKGQSYTSFWNSFFIFTPSEQLLLHHLKKITKNHWLLGNQCSFLKLHFFLFLEHFVRSYWSIGYPKSKIGLREVEQGFSSSFAK